jgi:hypothetical protein
MDDIKAFKEKVINDYIYHNIDLTHAGAKDIKFGLKSVLGEEPAIKFLYKENMKINETSGKVERLPNELESIEVYYTYIGSDNIPHASHMTYIVN